MCGTVGMWRAGRRLRHRACTDCAQPRLRGRRLDCPRCSLREGLAVQVAPVYAMGWHQDQVGVRLARNYFSRMAGATR